MTTMFKSMGIDPSTKATGIVVLGATSREALPETLLHTDIKIPKLVGMLRHRAIVMSVMELLHLHKPDRIVVEGYSLNMKNASSVVPLVELGGILRLMLSLDGLAWYDPRATEMKKFVTGKGTSEKDQVMMHVLKRWGFESASNNEADAYGLAAMGLAHANRLKGTTKDQIAVVGKMEERKN